MKNDYSRILTKPVKDGRSFNAGRDGIPVTQLSVIGEFVREWSSMREAEQGTGVAVSHISECCAGKRFSAGGYRWTYHNN